MLATSIVKDSLGVEIDRVKYESVGNMAVKYEVLPSPPPKISASPCHYFIRVVTNNVA